MNRIKLKNIKFSEWASEETNCFQAGIYFDNKLVGECSNEGRGGSTYCCPYGIENKEKFAEAEAYCLSLPPIKYDSAFGQDGFELDCNLEHVVDLLFEDWLKEKEKKKIQKDFDKGICFAKNDYSYQITTFKKGGNKLTIKEMLQNDVDKKRLQEYCNEKINEGFKILNDNLNF